MFSVRSTRLHSKTRTASRFRLRVFAFICSVSFVVGVFAPSFRMIPGFGGPIIEALVKLLGLFASGSIGCEIEGLEARIKATLKATAERLDEKKDEIKNAGSDAAIKQILLGLATRIPPPASICHFTPTRLTLDDGGSLRKETHLLCSGVGFPLISDRDEMRVRMYVQVEGRDGVPRPLSGAIISYVTRKQMTIDLTRAKFEAGDRQLRVHLARVNSPPVRDEDEDEDAVETHLISLQRKDASQLTVEVTPSPHQWTPPAVTVDRARPMEDFPNPFNKDDPAERDYWEALGPPKGKRASRSGRIDRDFGGHGPLVVVAGEVSFTDSTIRTRVSMWGLEWENGRRKSDYTMVMGWSNYEDVTYSPPNGFRIVKIDGPLVSRRIYRDNNHEPDDLEGNSGPVRRFIRRATMLAYRVSLPSGNNSMCTWSGFLIIRR